MAPVLAGLVLAVSAVKACEHTAEVARATDRNVSFRERREAYEKAIGECPGDSQLHDQLALLLIANHDYSAALIGLDKERKLFPERTEVRILRASALLPLGRAREVVADLDKISTGEARFYLGLAQRQLQNHAEARSSFLDAWQLGYRNGYVLYSIVEEDYALGDKLDGLDYFQLLLKEYPNSPWEHLLLADAYFAKDQTGKARAEYLKALSLKPDLLGANFRLGYMAFQSGDREAAAAYFRNETSLNPAYVDAHVFLSETLLQLDRKQEAIPELREALRLDPSSDLIYKRLSSALVETKQLEEAVVTLKKAEQRFPQNPAFPAQLARVLTLMNQPREAQEEANRARVLTAAQHRAQEFEPKQ